MLAVFRETIPQADNPIMTVTGLLSIEVLDQPSVGDHLQNLDRPFVQQSIYIAAVQSLITSNPSLKHQLHGMGTNIGIDES